MAAPRSRRGEQGGEGAKRTPARARARRRTAQPGAAAGGQGATGRTLSRAQQEDLRRKLREKFH